MALKPGQEKCINTLVGPLAVSAGAGSGKTFTLTRRIVRALETGEVDGIDRVLAITFTTKAATELKSRIKGALRAAGLIDQALKVDAAWISTIHGACARILRAHALEVGVDPAFQVLDTPTARPLLDAAIEEVFSSTNEFVVPEGFDALFSEYAARSHGARGASVEGMVRDLVEAASAHPLGIDAIVVPQIKDAGLLVRQMMQAAEEMLEVAATQKQSSARDKLIDGTSEALRACENALALGLEHTDLVVLLNLFPVPSRTFGSTDFKAYVTDVADVYLQCASEARFGKAVCFLCDLKQIAAQVLALYQQKKRDVAGLDNNDLLIKASQALADHPALAALYETRFQMVMVDEFQDTDQLQINMIKRMAGENNERLCTVGDAQQSIYRFRGADVAVYYRHVAEVEQTNAEGLILLPDNFRSHADVLAFVDRIFEQPQVFGSSFMSLSPARDEARVTHPFLGQGSRVDVQLVVTDASKGAGAEAVAQSAAQGIAKRFAALRAAGHSASDMVVLMGSTTRADLYASALRDQGFACVVVKGSIFNRAPEVHLMVRLAQALENPLDSLALFEVLSSEMFTLAADDFLVLGSFYDEETRTWRRRPLFSGLCALLQKDDALSAPLAAAVALVDGMTSQVGRVPLARLMEAAVRECGWLSRLQAEGAEGQARAANVFKAIRIMENIEQTQTCGVASAVAQFAAQIEIAKEAPGALSAQGGDFVRIMTVHASKGLEFPIVAVAELRQGESSAGKLCSESVNGRIYASLDLGNSVSSYKASSLVAKAAKAVLIPDESDDDGAQTVIDAQTAGARRAALRAYAAENEAQEARRLLYVALTRAKEALVVSLTGKCSKENLSGAGKGINADIQSALCGVDGVFPVGCATFDFGGTRPASFECIKLSAEDEQADAEDTREGDAGTLAPEDARKINADALTPGQMPEEGICAPVSEDTREGGAGVSAPEDTREIDIYAVHWPAASQDRPISSIREGVFSYSSIAPALTSAKNDTPLESSLIGAPISVESPEASSSTEVFSSADTSSFLETSLSFSLDDDEAWDAIRTSLFDEADATDLGTAFHRLAQLAVLRHAAGKASAAPVEHAESAVSAVPVEHAESEAAASVEHQESVGAAGKASADKTSSVLTMPDATRIDALCRSCGLGAQQRVRLEAALDRWFASEVAHEVVRYSQVRAEVPFFQPLFAGDAQVFLEGEIDLLATNEQGGGHALIVDYKTGGKPDETDAYLHEKHALQATCYAYALLKQGYDQVDAIFVRVEQVDPKQPDQPQCVRYHFEATDAPRLAQTITEAYRKAHA